MTAALFYPTFDQGRHEDRLRVVKSHPTSFHQGLMPKSLIWAETGHERTVSASNSNKNDRHVADVKAASHLNRLSDNSSVFTDVCSPSWNVSNAAPKAQTAGDTAQQFESPHPLFDLKA